MKRSARSWWSALPNSTTISSTLPGSAGWRSRAPSTSCTSCNRWRSPRVYAEGLVAQIMHIGPYAAEGPTIERLHRFIADHGYRCAGKHHEIYLGDPRKTAPERL